jgi:hypothetical protein
MPLKDLTVPVPTVDTETRWVAREIEGRVTVFGHPSSAGMRTARSNHLQSANTEPGTG